MDEMKRLDDILRSVFATIPELLNEKQKRLLAAAVARGYGRGGIKVVSEVSGMDPKTIRAGIRDLADPSQSVAASCRIRRPGAGRPGVEKKYPNIADRVQEILDGNTYGDPERVLTWTNLSLRNIAEELDKRFQIIVSRKVVRDVLDDLGYSLQVNQKMEQVGNQHPDRDKQFRFIEDKAKAFLAQGDPVISVDTKKKELIGNFKNPGAEWRPSHDPRHVLDHDFPLGGGKVAPYGVYLVNENTGFVNLGTDHDTSAFAVESIRRWWNIVGRNTFPNATRLYINCHGGWKQWVAREAVEIRARSVSERDRSRYTRFPFSTRYIQME